MNKQQIVDAIQQLNKSARCEFLSLFNETQLDSYLKRLTQLVNQRGRNSAWVRTGDTPAIVHRLCI